MITTTLHNTFAAIGYLTVAAVALIALWSISSGSSATAANPVQVQSSPMVVATGTGAGGNVASPIGVTAGMVGSGGNAAR